MLSYEYTNDANLVYSLLRRIQGKLPKTKVKFSDSDEMRVRVKGNTIWMPNQKAFARDHIRALKMLAWAYVFCLDKNERPFVHWLFYWFPVYFSVFSFISVLAIWFSKFFLLFFLFSFFLFSRRKQRCQLLARAYAAVLAVNIWRHGTVLKDTRKWITDRITGPFLLKRIDAEEIINEYEMLIIRVDSIKQENILDYSVAFVDLYEVLTDIDLEE